MFMLPSDFAIVFWFYKEPEIAKNHLQLLRKHNPDYRVFGVFGGNPSEAGAYEEALGAGLDDFWTYPGTYGNDSRSKWIFGNLMLVDWYDKRGRDLPWKWKSIAITQWDMLVFDDILNQLPGLRPGQVYFAGNRELDKTVENQWAWTRPDGRHRHEYDEFVSLLAKEYGWYGPLRACVYLLEVLTREFFDEYMEVPNKKIGMLEYKDPTLAEVWGLNVYERDLGVNWGDWHTVEEAALIARHGILVTDEFVREQLAKTDGWRIFHPSLSLW